MYCGDETGSFIGEIGSHTCRFGYGGEDNPKLVLPSYISEKSHMARSAVSSRIASQELEGILRRPDYTSEPLTNPNAFLRQGDLVENWDHLQTAWQTSMETLRATDTMKHTKGGTPYSSSISSKPTGTGNSGEGKCVHPILAVMPGMTQFDGHGPNFCAAVKRQQYVQYTEMVVESLEASSLFLAPSPMLAAFSFGRQTALVVDIGAGGTRVTPVVDGLLLKHAQRRSGRGGDWLGHVTWKALLEEKITPQPRYLVHNSSPTKAKSSLFHTWAMEELMYELRTEPYVTLNMRREDKFRVPFTITPDTSGTASPPSSPPVPTSPGESTNITNYELPDGTKIDLTTTMIGQDLKRIPELFFAKNLPFSAIPTSSPQNSNLQTLQDAPLQDLIHQSLLAVGDVDVRKDLSSNIVLTGGSSLFPNLGARLSHELSETLPAFTKPKVISPRFSVEKSCASWIGASILTSLGSFQQLWLSRTEYEEYGSTLAIQRFP